ncbi:Ldh family oxidoreductase [Rhodomicrobium lacus]|uniref:Ldh family oxidoreductase n=1 Tax=Rhodomicrobium lacus TaxID=2498452 RepID=UPI000F8F4C30|nr:Ldh family oxidoreductase [Rhodomicrobium lacus]
MPILTIDEAEELTAQALQRSGANAASAASTAHALVAAEADGLKGHGLVRVPTYAAQLKSGKVKGDAVPSATLTRPAALLIDAGYGFAYPALELAVERLVPLARKHGIALAGVTRSHHCGAAGLPVEALARNGIVSLLFANAPAAMAPWGGRTPLFGTNPLAFGCPLPAGDPIVVDMSLSKVARGNIIAAKRKGEAIPPDWAMDAEGRPTTDPAAALAGTMAPLGDAKGVALALMVELLAAGLTGSRFASEATSFLDDIGEPPATGQLLIAIDPLVFSDNALERFAVLARMIEAQEGARLPGARRYQIRAASRRDGLDVAEPLVAEIAALGA